MDERFTPGQAAKFLGVSKKTLQRWDASGKFKANRTQLNRPWYSRIQLEQFLGIKAAESKVGISTDFAAIPTAPPPPVSVLKQPTQIEGEKIITDPMDPNYVPMGEED